MDRREPRRLREVGCLQPLVQAVIHRLEIALLSRGEFGPQVELLPGSALTVGYVDGGGEAIDCPRLIGLSVQALYCQIRGGYCLSPNPPMRSGLGVRTRGEGHGTRRSALDSDKWGRWRPLVVVGGAGGGPGQRRCGGVGGTVCRGRQSRTGPVRLCGAVGWSGSRVRRRRCRQAGNGRARNRAMARVNWVSQGQPCGRCKVRRRAERVSRPAREKKRRR